MLNVCCKLLEQKSHSLYTLRALNLLPFINKSLEIQPRNILSSYLDPAAQFDTSAFKNNTKYTVTTTRHISDAKNNSMSTPSTAPIQQASKETTGLQQENPITGDDAAAALSFLKSPKGMRDIAPAQAWQRKKIFDVITSCFERHGALPIDTPVCERREVLQGNYGEESKLIFNLEDQGGELLSLRYDLTVPFARFLGQNKIQAMTRYHIGKVYRRDAVSKIQGRFREFYQCDIDFAGKHDLMMADAECLEILCEILKGIKLPYNFTIKINHRQILSGMFKFCGVPETKFKTICSSIDKLDKVSWEEVRKEMCEKGLDADIADKIGKFIVKSGSEELIDHLLSEELSSDADAKLGLDELKVLYKYAKLMQIDRHLKFDLSLARGLDYYTGLIYEAVVDSTEVEVGSIAAGGRYDNLVSTLLDCPGFSVPCVGLSIGIERLFAVLDAYNEKSEQVQIDPQIHCYVGSIGDGMVEERFKIVQDLRNKGFRVRNVLKDFVKPLTLYQLCERDEVPYAVFFGKGDFKENSVTLRNLSLRQDEKIKMDELADKLSEKLNVYQ